jgi:hypothetical protein
MGNEQISEEIKEVFKHNLTKPGRDTRARQREELIQLAAMAIRAIYDTIDHDYYADDSSSGGCI